MKNLQVQELTLAFGEREILKDISFTMNGNTRAALSGANGSGKSTMLKALTGIIPSDSRKLSVTKDSRISYLPQSDIVLPEKSIYETAEDTTNKIKFTVTTTLNSDESVNTLSVGREDGSSVTYTFEY